MRPSLLKKLNFQNDEKDDGHPSDPSAMLLLGSCIPHSGNELAKADREKLISPHDGITKPAQENPQDINWNEFVKAHYADDAILMPPNAPLQRGKTLSLPLSNPFRHSPSSKPLMLK